jgi:hypothetical protein
MTDDKICTLKVEVPRKPPELKGVVKDALKEAFRTGLIEMGNSLIERLSRKTDNSGIELRIDIPKPKLFPEPKNSKTSNSNIWEEEEESE